jgi:AcrR family transcriptional regulator
MIEKTATPRRSDASRMRILEAARTLFARQGYGRTTIREIAEAADINPSLVIRYYGSKAALFANVATLRFEAEATLNLPRDKLGEGLVRHVMGRWEHPQQGPALAAMMRAAISSETAQSRINEMFAQQLQALFQSLGLSEQSPATGPLIATQLLGLGLARYVLKLPAVVELPTETVVAQIGRVVQSYIDAQ